MCMSLCAIDAWKKNQYETLVHVCPEADNIQPMVDWLVAVSAGVVADMCR